MSQIHPICSTEPEKPTALEIARELAATFAASAAERDRTGGHPAAERQLLRDSGLLQLAIPKEYGGGGASWSEVLQTVRILAEADSALAHVYAFHHLQQASVLFYGDPEQQRRLLTESARHNQFWGNALNPLDRRAVATRQPDGGFLVSGEKAFCSGARGSDRLLLSAWDEPSQSLLIASVPTGRAGIRINDDWDPIGQRQTDSGSVTFERLAIQPQEILVTPGQPLAPQATLRTCLVQLIMANLFVGIARGALETARRYIHEQARPWLAAEVAVASEDPYLQQRFGRLWLQVKPAQLLAEQAALAFDDAFAKGAGLDEASRGEIAVQVAEAKVLAHHAGLDSASQIFDLMGARATSARQAYDRFWRNVRTHTLHDPVDYKIRDIGRWALSGTLPTPTPYS